MFVVVFPHCIMASKIITLPSWSENRFKSQFFSEWNLCLIRVLIVLFFPLWPKSSWLKSKSFIFFRSIFSRFGRHSMALVLQAGLVKTIQTASSTRYIAAATWLHVSPIPAIHVKCQVLFLLTFQVLSKFCAMDPLLIEFFCSLLWW